MKAQIGSLVERKSNPESEVLSEGMTSHCPLFPSPLKSLVPLLPRLITLQSPPTDHGQANISVQGERVMIFCSEGTWSMLQLLGCEISHRRYANGLV